MAVALRGAARRTGERRPAVGLAGFRMWSRERDPDGEWLDGPRFLTGTAGNGRALLATVTDVEPAWGRVILLSVLTAA